MADRSQWTVMTVEHRETAGIPSRNNQIILNQLREITGNSDVIALQQALQAAQGDVSQAVALLTETPNQNAGCALSSSQSHRSLPNQSQNSTGVIDLTGDDKDDLQRAIALSLQETSERAVRADLTTEEQDISRVLEESLAEASGPGGVKRKRDSPCACSCPREGDGASGGGAAEGEVAVSAVRAPGAPVGLKNVGNTCWFSAVVQSLFHLPGFRRLILGFTLPDSRLQNPQSENERVGLCFMRELRVLFALMVGSVRGFVDPSPAVHILKGAFRGADTQQDVSEFTHKLLDWLEDAFRISAEESRDDSLKTVNPMVDLFYGRARSIGTNQGKRFAVLEGFGPLPVRVSGFHDLHECLEHATMAGDIEQQQQQPPACASSGQELWFSELPPVLTLELSRFRFNTEVGRPEKIHSRLEFPDTIYMDRYMESNKEVTRIKRDEIRRLSEQQSHLQQTLARYQSYGSGPQRYPLVDILSCALQFASTPPATVLLPPTSLVNHKGPSSAAKPPCTLSTNHVTTSPTVSSSQVVSTNNIALFPIVESTPIPSTNHVVSSSAASPIPVLTTNHSDLSSTVPPTPMQSTNRVVLSPTSLPIPVPLTNHVAPSCATTSTPTTSINHTAPSPAVLPIHIASTNHVAPPTVVKSPADRALLVDDTGPVLINGVAELGVALPPSDESSKQPKAEALDINGDLSESESTAAPGCVVADGEVHQLRQQPQPPSAAAAVACSAPEPHHTQERHGARARQEVPAQQKSGEQNRTGDPPPPGTEQRTADSQQASVLQQGSLQQEAMQVDTLQENVQQGEEEGSQQKDITQQQQELAQGESNQQTETQQRFDLQSEANQVSLLQDMQQQQHRGNVQQEHVQQGNPQQGNFQQENSEQCKEQQEGSTQQCDVQRVQAVEARQEGGRLEWHGCPAPQAVTALELELVRAVLSRWNSQVQRELQDLQDSICRIKRTIDLMYTDKTFRQLPYRLHAVLVHDGQAMAGHYWAYVREHARLPAAAAASSSSSSSGNSASSNSNSVGASDESSGSDSCWRKFNDVRVSRASWAELVRDSYGGGARSASAYCLVYVNARAHDFTSELAGEAVGDLSSLSPALRDLVAKDNHRFLSEMAMRGNGPERPAEPDADAREPGQRAEPREHEQEERRHEHGGEQAPARAAPPAAAAAAAAAASREGEGSGAAREQERADKHSQTNSLEQEAEPTRERVDGRARAGEREETRVHEGRAPDVASISETQRQGSEADGSASLPGREGTSAPSPSPSGTEEYMKVGPDTPTEKPRVERVVEVSIPDVGTIVVQAEEHGYNDEVMLTPAMQGVLMAVARARLVREAQGPEATLIEAFRVEYARLRTLAQESYPDASSPASPPLAPAGASGAAATAWRGREERLEHVVIYLFQNEAPNRVVERALLEQFADRNLSYDEQLIKIMKVAQAKLQEISPEDMDPAEYQKWHQEYELFRQVCVYLVMGIEKYQEGRYTEALPCLMHAHAVNEELLARGQRRGVRRDVLARYRRVCVRRVNEACALTFGTGDVAQATRSLAVMTELVLPAMALLAPLGSSCEGGDAGDEAAVARESDLCAVELMRDRWCSYLGRDDMASELQELLTDFLPRLLDYQPEPAPPTQLTPPPLQGPPPPPPPPSEPRKCESSGENWRGLRAPPRLKAYSPHTLAEKMAEVLRVNRPREA
ncbi:ubiquitin carboxyl-terminal hydrolase 25-like isoform X2 [Petromyzon marinus]|uniref:ubiquitin carboxyl-terminal hydrolase 25-like isoform X2 n=1 Tax=Petromyzon marinus TaxID=7757 RepID=UPI003F726E7B